MHPSIHDPIARQRMLQRDDKIARMRRDGATYEAIAVAVGVTPERVAQILAQRKRKARRAAHVA